MLIGKNKKIAKYLCSKADSDSSVFDHLLTDYLDGVLKDKFVSIGMKKIAIHIDWHDDIKCVAIQGCYGEYSMDLQIYPDEFSLSFDLDEADEDAMYPLESKEQLYHVLRDTIRTL